MAKRRRGRRKRRINIAGLLIILIIFLVSAGTLLRIVFREEPQEDYAYVVEEPPLPYHNYNWTNLSKDGSFFVYEDENYTSLKGIDVSVHNEEINWEKVSSYDIDFAMIRVGYRGYTEGKLYEDAWFTHNIKGAKENGIKTGIYFFSQAITQEEALEEAEFVIRNIKDYDIDYPVVFDMEPPETDDIGRTESLTRSERTRIAITFLKRIEDAGYQPMIYDSTLLYEEDYELKYLEPYPFWVADYHSYPQFNYRFDIWQYTNAAHLDGIEGNVDLNIQLVKKTTGN